jgi:four helix bundle protein
MKGDGAARRGGNANRFDLEGRLLVLASAVIDLSEELPKTRVGLHVGGQILRSGTSPYSNHGEAEAAESRDDFIHKMRICLKELRETRRWARLIRHRGWCEGSAALGRVLSHADELVRIFSASIRTAHRNRERPTAS